MPETHRHLPFLATLLAIALLSLMDGLMKGAAAAAGAFTALLLRSIIGVLVAGPVWLAIRTGPTPPALRRIHIKRGIVLALMGFTFFWGLARLPLAEGLALSFVAPLMALFLAAVLLGERIRRQAILASVLGLAGMLVIVLTRFGPESAGAAEHPEAALGTASVLISSMLYAWNLVLQRQQAQLARPVEVAAWQNLVCALVFLPGAPFLLQWPDGPAGLYIVGSAALSLTGALLFAWAYARAEAQVLVPLEYTGFAWAALFGWLLFGESVRLPVIAGAALIMLGCWIAVPRRPLRKRPEQSVV